jgi:NADH dehydrogenase
MSKNKARIIIVGGGFAGVKCARELLKKRNQTRDFELVVFNQENHMVFHPLLAEIASAALQPQGVAAPLRQMLIGATCRTEDVLAINLEEKSLHYQAFDSSRQAMTYDFLVISCGSLANLSLVPGVDENAFSFKTIGDALAIQSHIMEQLEKAEVCDNPAQKKAYLSFVVIGGGFSGVELAGEINDLVRRSIKFFGSIKEEEVQVVLVHSKKEILPEVGSKLRAFAQKKMEAAGIRFCLGQAARQATAHGVICMDGTYIATHTIVSTIGTMPHPLVQRLNLEKVGGRLKTRGDLSLEGYQEVFAIGDCAYVFNAFDQMPCPPTAQFAEQEGKVCAKNIIALLNQKTTQNFSYQSRGQLCSIGGHNAVAEIQGQTISGFLAWFLWRGIYLSKLPSLSQKAKVGLQWLLDLIFPRTLAHLKTNQTRRLRRAYFAGGETIFRQGDAACEFYSIEEGQVEVVKEMPEGEKIIAILGKGDFFGENALIDNSYRNATIRARTAVELVVMGRGILKEIADSLNPLAQAIAQAMKRRTSLDATLNKAREILDNFHLDVVIERLPACPLKESASVREAIDLINNERLDFLCVINEKKELEGIITRSDLLRVIEVAQTHNTKPGVRIAMSVKDIMVKDPVCLTLEDNLTTALLTMREHNLKRLPVIISGNNHELVGYVRLENIMHCLSQAQSDHDFFERRRRTGEFVNPT